MAITPDGESLIVVGHEKLLRVFDLVTHALRASKVSLFVYFLVFFKNKEKKL